MNKSWLTECTVSHDKIAGVAKLGKRGVLPRRCRVCGLGVQLPSPAPDLGPCPSS